VRPHADSVLPRKTIAPIHERTRELVELVLVILAKHSESLHFDANVNTGRTIEARGRPMARSSSIQNSRFNFETEDQRLLRRRSFDHTRVSFPFFFISAQRGGTWMNDG